MVKAEVPGQRRALALVPRPLYPSPPGPWPCYGSHRASPPQALGLSSCTPLYIWHYLPSPCHRTTLRATTRHALHRHINTIIDPSLSLKSSHIPKGAPEIILGETTQKSSKKYQSPLRGNPPHGRRSSSVPTRSKLRSLPYHEAPLCTVQTLLANQHKLQ